MRRSMKIALIAILLPYPLSFAGFYISMRQSPEVFSGIMSIQEHVVISQKRESERRRRRAGFFAGNLRSEIEIAAFRS